MKNMNNIKLLSQKHMKMPKVEQRRKESEELLLKGLSKNKIYIWLGIVVIALLMASVIGKNQRLEEFPSFVSHSRSEERRVGKECVGDRATCVMNELIT